MKPLSTLEVERKRKIFKLAKDVRKKFQALKLGRSEEDDTLKKIFKPITLPLRELVEQKQQQQQQQQTPRTPKRPLKQTPQTPKQPKQQVNFIPTYDLTSEAADDEDSGTDDDIYETQKAIEDFNKSIQEKAGGVDQYISQYPENAHDHIRQFFSQSPNIEVNYGPTYNPETSRWKLGNVLMDFDIKNGNLLIGGKDYGNSEGLYNLIFYKDPPNYSSKEDLPLYKEILEKTNLYRMGYTRTGKIKGNSSKKYTDIVKPLLAESKFRPRFSSFQGSGLVNNNKMIYNKNPIDYVYWNNVNELVDRLRLLYASKQAGNTSLSHNNEILSIIEELREEKVIY